MKAVGLNKRNLTRHLAGESWQHSQLLLITGGGFFSKADIKADMNKQLIVKTDLPHAKVPQKEFTGMKLAWGRTSSELKVLTVAELISLVRGKEVRFVYQTEEEANKVPDIDHHAIAMAVSGPYNNTTGGNVVMITIRRSQTKFSVGDGLADALESLNCPNHYVIVAVQQK